MSKRSNLKWKLSQLRIRSQIFLRRNGLQVFIMGSMVALGATAVFIFTQDNKPEERVNHSDDQKLNDVLNADDLTQFEIKSATPIENTKKPIVMATPETTVMPDFTIAPSATPGNVQASYQPPVDGSIIRVFSINSLIYSETLNQWMTHSGVDIAAPKGTDVRSIDEGTVENVYYDDMMGMTVIIKHSNNIMSVYSNLKQEVSVEIGDSIEARAIIGQIGDTALEECLERSHLHFELLIDEQPVNPTEYMLFKQE